jgi:hypothetical protein
MIYDFKDTDKVETSIHGAYTSELKSTSVQIKLDGVSMCW